MKEIKNVRSESYPVEVDDYSNGTTIFIRTNIKEEIEEDPVFKTSKKVYVYDETQYTHQEWCTMTIKLLKEDIVSLRSEIDKLKSK